MASTGSNMMLNVILLHFLVFLHQSCSYSSGPRLAPYIDLSENPSLTYISKETGINAFTLTYVRAISDHFGCHFKWNGFKDLNDKQVMKNINQFMKQGGNIVISIGGPQGSNFTDNCSSYEQLTSAFVEILDTFGSSHLDLNIETVKPQEIMMKSLARIQAMRPDTTVRLTLLVQNDAIGLDSERSLNQLKLARRNGLRVDIVNPMIMEFNSSRKDWGQASIQVLRSTMKQMILNWPEKTPAQLKSMLGATPLIGRNANGRVFKPVHARRLLRFACKNDLGFLGFWSIGRDANPCPGMTTFGCNRSTFKPFVFSKIFNNLTSKSRSKRFTPMNEDAHWLGLDKPDDDSPVQSFDVDESLSNDSIRNDGNDFPASPQFDATCIAYTPSMDSWCGTNCPKGDCPPSMCQCGPNKKPFRECRGINVAFKEWCFHHCARDRCPKNLCQCKESVEHIVTNGPQFVEDNQGAITPGDHVSQANSEIESENVSDAESVDDPYKVDDDDGDDRVLTMEDALYDYFDETEGSGREYDVEQEYLDDYDDKSESDDEDYPGEADYKDVDVEIEDIFKDDYLNFKGAHIRGGGNKKTASEAGAMTRNSESQNKDAKMRRNKKKKMAKKTKKAKKKHTTKKVEKKMKNKKTKKTKKKKKKKKKKTGAKKHESKPEEKDVKDESEDKKEKRIKSKSKIESHSESTSKPSSDIESATETEPKREDDSKSGSEDG